MSISTLRGTMAEDAYLFERICHAFLAESVKYLALSFICIGKCLICFQFRSIDATVRIDINHFHPSRLDNMAELTDKFGVSPAQMDIGESKDAEDSNHIEQFSEKETSDYYSSPEFKARERRVVRKMDFYIAPWMGSFNFIVRLE